MQYCAIMQMRTGEDDAKTACYVCWKFVYIEKNGWIWVLDFLDTGRLEKELFD